MVCLTPRGGGGVGLRAGYFLFEYLALAVAIVAPDQPNHHEILEHGRSAMLYDTKDPAGLEKSIEALVSNEALRESIAAAGPSVSGPGPGTRPAQGAWLVDILFH